jgi:hypothetical protein
MESTACVQFLIEIPHWIFEHLQGKGGRGWHFITGRLSRSLPGSQPAIRVPNGKLRKSIKKSRLVCGVTAATTSRLSMDSLALK